MLQSAPTREKKDVLYTILLFSLRVYKFHPMSSHHNTTLNFSHSPYKNKPFSSHIDLEIKRGELRLRYVKLLRDINTSLCKEDATDLINESISIWDKLNSE